MLYFSQELAQLDDELLEEITAEEYQHLCEFQTNLPELQTSDELSKPLGHGGITIDDLDFTPLVDMRRRHQTRQAALGVHTRKSKSTDPDITLKQNIVRSMREVLKEQDDRAVGTGCECSARWGTSDATGNSANAAAAAVTLAKKVWIVSNLFYMLLTRFCRLLLVEMISSRQPMSQVYRK
jgi:hypothetical protein